MQISVTIKESYGRSLIYPACETADMFCRIANKTTLSEQVIKYIKALGYTIKVKQEEVIL
jgi:hypothetical protein